MLIVQHWCGKKHFYFEMNVNSSQSMKILNHFIHLQVKIVETYILIG